MSDTHAADPATAYGANQDCPKHLRRAPCPLYGGETPRLVQGRVSELQFGACSHCEATLIYDREGNPLGARLLT